MKNPTTILSRLIIRGLPLLSLSVALLLPLVPSRAAPASDNPTSKSTSDKAAKLPLDPVFKKETSGESKGLYILTLKNVSEHPVKVGGTIAQSVVSHSRPKTITLEVQTIAPGKTRKIEQLAAQDKLTLTAEGFEPLDLTVP